MHGKVAASAIYDGVIAAFPGIGSAEQPVEAGVKVQRSFVPAKIEFSPAGRAGGGEPA